MVKRNYIDLEKHFDLKDLEKDLHKNCLDKKRFEETIDKICCECHYVEKIKKELENLRWDK